MGDSNTNQSTGNVEAVTALTNAATIRKLLRLPNEEGKTNFEILEVRSISDLANGHNCEVTIRVDLAFGHEGLPVPENERYSVRTETVRRIDLKEVAKLAGLEINDKQQYVGSVTDVESVGALLKAKLTEDDITIAQIKDVMWVRAKPESVGFVGMLTFAEGGESGEKLPTSITAVPSKNELDVNETANVAVTVLPANATDKTWVANSSDTSILTINANGTVVTAVNPGTAKIYYSPTANPSAEIEVEFLVKSEPVIEPTELSVTDVPSAMNVGDIATYQIAIAPEGAAQDYEVVVNSNEARVNKTDKTITILRAGNISITFLASANYGVSQEVVIVATAAPILVNEINAFAVPEVGTEFSVGAYVEMGVDVLPETATDRSYTLVSSNPAIIEVSNGSLIAKAPGTATVKAVANDAGHLESSEVTYTIRPAVTALTFTSTSQIPLGDGSASLELTVDRTPAEATAGKVVYSVVQASSGVLAEIARGSSTLTLVGLQQSSTVKVKATISTWTSEGMVTVSKEQTISVIAPE